MRRKRVDPREQVRVAALVRAGANPADRRVMARTLGVSARTIFEWGRKSEVKRWGRPLMKWKALYEAVRTIRPAWKVLAAEMTKTAPGPGVPVLRNKCPEVSRYLLEKYVASKKRTAAKHRRREEEKNRRSVKILFPGVVTTIDGLFAGREEETRIEAHVFRDRASLRFQAGLVGTGIKSDVLTPTILDVLDRTGSLVLQADGDPRHKVKGLRRGLRCRWIMFYPSEPHTPQHNPIAEEGMRELRSFIPMGGVSSIEEGASLIKGGFLTLNREWPRLSRGGLSSEVLYALPRVEINREVMYRSYVMIKRRFRREAGRGLRARIRADRRAVEATLVSFGLALVSGRGAPLRGVGVGRN